MPEEVGRTTSLKRIYNPDDESQFVDIPVIDLISFIDPYSRHQETQFTFLNNDETADRDIHVVRVENSEDGSQYVMVERIDCFKVLDPYDRHWETQHSPDNVTGEEDSPPHFRSHNTTHVKRIYGDGSNSGCYIDVERIDEIEFTDSQERHQTSIYSLNTWSDENEE